LAAMIADPLIVLVVFLFFIAKNSLTR